MRRSLFSRTRTPKSSPRQRSSASSATTGRFAFRRRFFVHKDIEKKFTEAAVESARALKLGNGLEPGIEIGPMFERKAMDNTLELIKDAAGKGAQVLTG